MIFVREGETVHAAAKRQCAERGHDFYRSHRCWNCNMPISELNKVIIVSPRREPESFDNDYRFNTGSHL